MAANLTQIVDSIGASPTVLLDLNNEAPYGIKAIDLTPPPLRYTTSSSAISDGDLISSSAYGNRSITITFDLIQTTQDTWAASWQTLARQLDRDTFIIKYQPTGATAPVFFNCYRADVTDILDVAGATAYRMPTVTIPAEPFGLGLRHDVAAAVTVNNDPAAGSNGLFFDVTGIRGDVPSEALLWTTNVANPFFVATEKSPPAGVYFVQAETGTLGTDTTLPGADALMSGTGSSYTRTSFATATMVDRVTGMVIPATIPAGDYRMYCRARTSVAGTTVQIQPYIDSNAGVGGWNTDLVTAALFTTPAIIDLGMVSVAPGVAVTTLIGRDVAVVLNAPKVAIQAARTAGTGSLDLDYILLVPASLTYAELQIGAATGRSSVVVDGVNDAVFSLTTAGPFTGSPKVQSPATPPATQPGFVGSLPMVYPGYTTRFHYLLALTATKATTSAVSVSYWPKYLFVRPATT